MSSASPPEPPASLEERLAAAESRAAAAETGRERAAYRILHLTRAFDAQRAELAALRAQSPAAARARAPAPAAAAATRPPHA